jgi:2-iminoacetate synthase
MSTFKDIWSKYDWEQVKEKIYTTTSHEVIQTLNKTQGFTPDDFRILISPAAAPFLNQLAEKSQKLTQKRFGKTVQMYVPLYLSNECQNICTYCGFSLDNKIPRKTLSEKEVLKEVEVIKSMGFDHVLLVTGEANKTVNIDYFIKIIRLIKPYFSNISIEVQPLEKEEYELLAKEGIYAVLVYQETYHLEAYQTYHPKGKKSNFFYRLETPERVGEAQMHKIGIGALLGLEDWRTDSFYAALHLDYLEKRFWQTKFSISFPRMRPYEGEKHNYYSMADKELLQLICAYRILNEQVELSISTREKASFRDHIFTLGITSMSAGSKTEPGGYANPDEALEQFEIDDDRSPQMMKEVIQNKGYEAVWKDWF